VFTASCPRAATSLRATFDKAFLNPWDEWLRQAILASRDTLAEHWLDIYLTSPVWRFALSAGCCGPDTILGVLIPSVDKVGRYFPLTLGRALAPGLELTGVIAQASSWYRAIEALALAALEPEFNLEAFAAPIALELAATVMALPPIDPLAPPGLSVPFNGDAQSIALRQAHHPLAEGRSLWWTSGSTRVAPCLLICPGMPPASSFAALLDGDWSRDGWDVPVPEQPEPALASSPETEKETAEANGPVEADLADHSANMVNTEATIDMSPRAEVDKAGDAAEPTKVAEETGSGEGPVAVAAVAKSPDDHERHPEAAATAEHGFRPGQLATRWPTRRPPHRSVRWYRSARNDKLFVSKPCSRTLRFVMPNAQTNAWLAEALGVQSLAAGGAAAQAATGAARGAASAAAANGSASGGELGPMRPDCKIVHGKVPGPRQSRSLLSPWPCRRHNDAHGDRGQCLRLRQGQNRGWRGRKGCGWCRQWCRDGKRSAGCEWRGARRGCGDLREGQRQQR